MKRSVIYTIGAIMALGTLLQSCEKDLLYTNFTINRSSEFKIPALPAPLNLPENHDSMSLQGHHEFQKNDTRLENIEEIVAKDVDFVIKAPDDRDFDFLEEIQLYIETENLPKRLVAERQNIPDNIGQVLKMKTRESVNLAPYAKEGTFKAVYAGKTEKATDSETKLEVRFRFDVKAKVIN